MRTNYENQWPGMKPRSEPEVAPEMRIGQLKYSLRESEKAVHFLEWVCFVEFVAIVALIAVCAS